MFATVLAPPLLTGMMWSKCRFSVCPHCRQRPPSRAETAILTSCEIRRVCRSPTGSGIWRCGSGSRGGGVRGDGVREVGARGDGRALGTVAVREDADVRGVGDVRGEDDARCEDDVRGVGDVRGEDAEIGYGSARPG